MTETKKDNCTCEKHTKPEVKKEPVMCECGQHPIEIDAKEAMPDITNDFNGVFNGEKNGFAIITTFDELGQPKMYMKMSNVNSAQIVASTFSALLKAGIPQHLLLAVAAHSSSL